VGSINVNDVISYAVSGPTVRSVGVKKDIRLYNSETYASYWFLSLHSFLGKRGDSYDRFLIRVREMYESINIVFQVLSNLTNFNSDTKNTNLMDKKANFFSFFNFLYNVKKNQLNRKTKYNSMENLISHFKQYSEGMTVDRGFTYNAVEAPKGEFGVSLISDGTSKPYRCKIRTPAYHHMHVMSRMVQGHYMADLVTVLGSQDIVFGDVDR
jgi:NADH:ubiquinone oxidoreductase subunit D